MSRSEKSKMRHWNVVLFFFLLGTLSHRIRDGDVKDAWDPFPG
jgi:hypothetical protein